MTHQVSDQAEPLPVVVRLGNPADRDLVVPTWLQSFETSVIFKNFRIREYKAIWRTIIHALLDRSQLLIAHPPEDPDLILGWLVYELHPRAGPVLHYCYTKSSFESYGIQRELLHAAGLSHGVFSYTHKTIDSMRILAGWMKAGKRGSAHNIDLLWAGPPSQE
jgi:hypothetical protein